MPASSPCLACTKGKCVACTLLVGRPRPVIVLSLSPIPPLLFEITCLAFIACSYWSLFRSIRSFSRDSYSCNLLDAIIYHDKFFWVCKAVIAAPKSSCCPPPNDYKQSVIKVHSSNREPMLFNFASASSHSANYSSIFWVLYLFLAIWERTWALWKVDLDAYLSCSRSRIFWGDSPAKGESLNHRYLTEHAFVPFFMSATLTGTKSCFSFLQ